MLSSYVKKISLVMALILTLLLQFEIAKGTEREHLNYIIQKEEVTGYSCQNETILVDQASSADSMQVESMTPHPIKKSRDKSLKMEVYDIRFDKILNDRDLTLQENKWTERKSLSLRNAIYNLLPENFNQTTVPDKEKEEDISSKQSLISDYYNFKSYDDKFNILDQLQQYESTVENEKIPYRKQQKEKKEILANKPLVTGTGFPSIEEFNIAYNINKRIRASVEKKSSLMSNNNSSNLSSNIYSDSTLQGCTDINADHIVNMFDFALFAQNWLLNGQNIVGDFNGDSSIGIEDVKEFVSYWLNDPGCAVDDSTVESSHDLSEMSQIGIASLVSDPNDSNSIYFPSELPYQTSFEPVQGYEISLIDEPNVPDTASILDGVQGWRVDDGVAALVWHNYVYMEDDPNLTMIGRQNAVYCPEGTITKRFINDNSDNRYVHFEIFPGKNSEVAVANGDDVIAGIKFDFRQLDPNDPNTAEYNIYLWNGDPNDGSEPGYYKTIIDYQYMFRLVNNYDGLDAPIRLQFMFDLDWDYGVYDVCVGAEGAPQLFDDKLTLMAANVPLGGSTYDRVRIKAVEDPDGTEEYNDGYLLFDRLMISDYCMLDGYPFVDQGYSWRLAPCAFGMWSPCQCITEENALQEALTPVLGQFKGYSTSCYNIMCCPIEEGDMDWFREGNEDELLQSFVDKKWYVSDVRHELIPNDKEHLGWFRTGIIPNGYYYLSVVIFSDVTAENGYTIPWDCLWLDHNIETSDGYVIEQQPASTLAVACNQKGQPYRTSYETAMKVPWAGDATGLPFNLTHYYSSNNCLKAKPFYNGWSCSFEYTLVEDTRFNFEYFLNGSDSKVPYSDRGGLGLGFGFVSIKKPDGSGQVFRREDGDSSYNEAVYYPYPDNGSNDKLIRKTITNNNLLTRITYKVITGDGREYYFVDDNITEEIPIGNSPLVGWRSDARIQSIKDRFGNTININWIYSCGGYQIDSASIGSGETERKIQFYDGSDDPYDPYYGSADGLIDKAVLIVGGDDENPIREVEYDIEYDCLHEFFSKHYRFPLTGARRYLTKFTISDRNTYVDEMAYVRDSIDLRKQQSHYYHPDMSGYIIANYQFCRLNSFLDLEDMWYDEWGSVREIYHPIDMSSQPRPGYPDSPDYNFVFAKAPVDLFTYENYTAGQDDIYAVDPNSSESSWLKVTQQKTAGWLSLSDGYRDYDDSLGYKIVTVSDPKGRIRGQRTLDVNGSIVNEYEYFYPEDTSLNSTKPYRIDQYYDGRHKITEMSYDYRGNLETKKEYDVANPLKARYEEYSWHNYYSLPESTTRWQVYGDDATIVRDIVVYGDKDGQVDSVDDEDRIYPVQQKKLLDLIDSDPNSPVYATTYMTYEPDGRVKTVIDPENKIQVVEYDDFGYQEKVYAENDDSELYLINRYKYDNIGQMRMEVDNRGIMTNYDYDGHGRVYEKAMFDNPTALLVDIDDPNFVFDGFKVEYYYGYDNRDRLTSEWMQEYGLGERYQCNLYYYIYDNMGHLIDKNYYEWINRIIKGFYYTHWLVRLDRSTYDYFGYQTSEIKNIGDKLIETSILNDEFGREVIRRKSNMFGGDVEREVYLQAETDYDSLGNIIDKKVFKNEGYYESHVVNGYDIFNRQISRHIIEDPNLPPELNPTSEYGYDCCDNKICVTDPEGRKIYTDYDNANRVNKVYFATDNDTKVTRKQNEYYDNDQIKRITEFDRDGSSILSDTEYIYDYRNRIKSTIQDIDGIDFAQTNIYYNDSDLTEPNNPDSYPVEFAGNLQYDIRIDDAEGKSTWRELDHNGKITEILYPSGLNQKWGYYPDGRLKSKTVYDYAGNEQLVIYHRDGYGRVDKKEFPDGSYISYEMDFFDHILSAGRYETGSETPVSEYSYSYTSLGQIETIADQDGFASTYKYRADGQVDSISIGTDLETDPNSIYQAYYSYDALGRNNAIYAGPESTDLIFTCDYDDNGNLEDMGYHNGSASPFTEIDYTYNFDNQLTGIDGSSYDLANVQIDGLGRITSGTETLTKPDNSTVVNTLSFGYNRLGSLTSANIGSFSGSYGYNKDGNINNRTENGLSEDFSYDFNGDGIDDSNMLTWLGSNPDIDWDYNGRLVRDGEFCFEYDYDGKLTNALHFYIEDLGVDYENDPLGNRIKRLDYDDDGYGEYRKYILDYSSEPPKILVELLGYVGGTAWYKDTNKYYYGNRLICSRDQYDQQTFYVHDRLGSVRSVVEDDGSVDGYCSYGPYGETIQGRVPDINIGFAGYNYDPLLCQYYVWARMYSPYLARFNGYDPVLGSFKEPFTLHQYLYCLNDPVNRVDPAGEFSKEETTVATGGSATLASNSSGAIEFGKELVQRLNMSLLQYYARLEQVYNTTAQKVGKPAEKALESAFSYLKDFRSQKEVTINGRTRILDFLCNNNIIESKNVAKLDYVSSQLKDYLAYAKENGYHLDIVIRQSTQVAASVEKWLEDNEAYVSIARVWVDL